MDIDYLLVNIEIALISLYTNVLSSIFTVLNAVKQKVHAIVTDNYQRDF